MTALAANCRNIKGLVEIETTLEFGDREVDHL